MQAPCSRIFAITHRSGLAEDPVSLKLESSEARAKRKCTVVGRCRSSSFRRANISSSDGPAAHLRIENSRTNLPAQQCHMRYTVFQVPLTNAVFESSDWSKRPSPTKRRVIIDVLYYSTVQSNLAITIQYFQQKTWLCREYRHRGMSRNLCKPIVE